MPTFYPGQTDYIDQLNLLAPASMITSYAAIVGSGNGLFPDSLPGASTLSMSFANSNTAGIRKLAVNSFSLVTSSLDRLSVAANGLISISAGLTITGNFTIAGPTNAVNIASDQTSGVLNLGSASGTGTITLGQSTGAQTVGVAIGVTASGSIKTLNLGTSGGAGSTTNITIGSLLGTTAVGIGAVTVTSAIVNIQSTTRGVRFPNMTTTQKNAITSPLAGLVIFDTTLDKLCVYSGSAWQTITSV